MRLAIEIPDENLADKIIKILEVFKDEGVKVYNRSYSSSRENLLKRDLRAIGMSTHSSNRDDDEYLYEAAWEFYNEKHTD